MFSDGMTRKAAQQIIMSLSATSLGSPETWNISERLLTKTLEFENEKLKCGEMQKSSALNKQELLGLVFSLTKRRVQNMDLWKLLIPPMVRHFNDNNFTLKDIAGLTHGLSIVKLQAPKLYQIIVDYFIKQGYTEENLI